MADPTELDLVEWEALGLTIRERRLARGLTLVGLASEVDLSQPFLSQVETVVLDVEVDIGGKVKALATGDFISYSSRLPHRLDLHQMNEPE